MAGRTSEKKMEKQSRASDLWAGWFPFCDHKAGRRGPMLSGKGDKVV